MKRVILHMVPTLEGGGAERQLSMLARTQSSRGCSVHVGVRRGGVYAEALRRSGVAVHLLGDHRGPSPLLLFNIDALLRRARPDVVQTWLPQMDILGGMASLRNSVPWVLSERSSHLAFERFGVLDRLRCHLAHYARAIVANSSGGVEYWRPKLPADARIVQIPNAVDVERIRCAGMPCGESLHKTRKSVLVVGRLAPEKSLDLIVKSIRFVPEQMDIHVTFIGEGPLRAELERMIVDEGLHERCAVLPFDSEWWRLMRDAPALISMSRFEGRPNVVLEAMAGNCPLIVSDIPAHREILDEASAILVPLGNIAALAAAISAVLADPASAHRRAVRASSRVSGMSIDAAADAYESVYEAVTRGSGR